MTELHPALVCEPPPPDLLLRLIRGDLPELAGAQVTRMHFPRGRPVQIHFRDGTGAWIAEWIGQAAPTRAMTEADRLERLGQIARLTADPVSGLLTRAPGADAKLPGLRLVHDPDFATATLSALGLPGPFRVDLVAHRLGKRAVLRLRHASGTAYARLRSPGATQARLASERHALLWQHLHDDKRLTLPEPLGQDATLGLSLYRALQGAAPRFRGLRGFVEAEALSHAIRALQSCQIDLPAHTIADEMATIRDWRTRLAALDAAAAAEIGQRIDRLEQELAALPVVAPVVCHRDLHEGQVLIRGGRAGIMDFDTLRLGDPALDLGNLQAHLVLMGLREGRNLAAFVTATERLFPHIPLRRIALWRRAALLRLALMLFFTAEAASICPSLLAAAE